MTSTTSGDVKNAPDDKYAPKYVIQAPAPPTRHIAIEIAKKGRNMPHVAANYLSNLKAPMGKWVCSRNSNLDPYDKDIPAEKTHYPDFCGQCVSYVTVVCPKIPTATHLWRKGIQVKGANGIARGTAIATFDKNGRYFGHAAIYESQDSTGINVVDQWITSNPQPIHRRKLYFKASRNSDNGDNFFVIE